MILQSHSWAYIYIYIYTCSHLCESFVLSPLTLLGAVPHHHLALSVKELTYSSN